MKNAKLLFILLLCVTRVSAQRALVANEELNLLYRGYDNKVAISMVGYDCSELSLHFLMPEQGDSIMIGTDACHYLVRTSEYGRVPLIISGRHGDTESSDTIMFMARSIPTPFPTLGGRLRGGIVNSGVLKSSPGIIPVISSDLWVRATVLSFELHYRTKDHKGNRDLKNAGPLFNKEMIEVLNKTKHGDTIVIRHVMVSYGKVPHEDIGDMLFLIREPPMDKQETKRQRLTKKLDKDISSAQIKTAREKTVDAAYRQIVGRWEIINYNEVMSMCGIPCEYCGSLPVCSETNRIHFYRNHTFRTDDGILRKYDLSLFDIDSMRFFRLVLDKDTFSILPIKRRFCEMEWSNGYPEESLYYDKLYFTLYKRVGRE